MRYLVILILALLFSSAQAKSFDMPPQLQLVAAGEVAITSTVGFRGHQTLFLVPTRNQTNSFTYLGPTFTKGKLWLSPQIGAVTNWPAPGVWSPIMSLWLSVSLPADCSIFVSGDYYPNKAGNSFYGYLSLDRAWKVEGNKVELGLHAEDIDENLWWLGPHVAVHKGPWSFGVFPLIGMLDAEGNNGLRFWSKVGF